MFFWDQWWGVSWESSVLAVGDDDEEEGDGAEEVDETGGGC